MKHYFVLPNNRALPSGGNLYNQYLIEALIEKGATVEILDFTVFKNHYEQEIEGIYWLDTLFMEDLHFLKKSTSDKIQFWLLTHFLQSLQPNEGQSATALFQQEHKVLQYLDGFLVPSPFMAEYLEDKGLEQEKLILPPPSPSKEEIIIQSVPLFGRLEGLKGLIVANLIECKGVLPFLQALSKYSTTNYTLTIVGRTDIEPDYTQQCYKLVESHPILKQTVMIHGTIPHQKTLELYQTHHCFISPSFMETYGMAIQEANTYQLPVLGLNRGNVPFHIEEGVNGKLLDTSEALAKAFMEWVEDEQVFDRFQKGASTRKIDEFYTWRIVAEKLLKKFEIKTDR